MERTVLKTFLFFFLMIVLIPGTIFFITSDRIFYLNIGIFLWFLLGVGGIDMKDVGRFHFFITHFVVGFYLWCWYDFLLHANLQDPNFKWIFGGLGPRSPCGASSCSSLTGVDNTYHPAGFFSGAIDVTKLLVTCSYPKCEWASSTGEKIRGYELDPISGQFDFDTPGPFATTRPEDYPDLAKGIVGGYFQTYSQITSTRFCPGVNLVWNQFGKIGKGNKVCSSCGPTAPGCPPAEDFWICWECPGYFSSDFRDPPTLRWISLYFLLISFIMVIYYGIAYVPKMIRSLMKFGKNKLSNRG